MPRVSTPLDLTETPLIVASSDLWAISLLIFNWASILFLLAFVGFFPNPFTLFLVWILLPGRQLGLSVLMHEASHNTLFVKQSSNRCVGEWLCALPTLNDFDTYARKHREHHRKAGTPNDPDLPNYAIYPIDLKSFLRKIIRDLTGQTAFKFISSTVDTGHRRICGEAEGDPRILYKQLLVQLMLAGFLILLGIGWTWWIWFAVFISSYMLVIRFRQIAEHAAITDPNNADPRFNTRPVEAGLLERALIAPNFVNFHLEHHIMPSVPCYRLPKFRAYLKEDGFLDNVPFFSSYGQVLKHVILEPK